MAALDLGPHAAFILAAYAAVLVVLSGLIAWLTTDARKQRRLLAELESQGVVRRSQRKTAAAVQAGPSAESGG